MRMARGKVSHMQNFTVVVSGFEPFTGEKVNPAAEVAKALEERGVRHGDPDIAISVTAVTLPLSFERAWPRLLETIEAADPDIVIACGLKHEARGVGMERCATNLMDSTRPDGEGVQPRRMPVDPDGPAAYWTRLPLRRILRSFTDDQIPASLSSDAGTYVCNSLFYRLLNWTHGVDEATGTTGKRVLAGFVSFPLINETDRNGYGLPFEQMVKAGMDVVRDTVSYYLEPESSTALIA